MRILFRSYLLSQSAISTAIGARCYPVHLPQNVTCPAITYQTISGSSDMSLGGRSALSSARIQVDVWAKTQDAAITIAGHVRTALDGVRVMIEDDDSPPGGIEITDSWMGLERDQYEDGVEAFRITMDFEIRYRPII